MNHAALNIHATITLHKPNTLIGPIVNWKNVPAQEIAKLKNKQKKHYNKHYTSRAYPTFTTTLT
jgi:hypothetical protein